MTAVSVAVISGPKGNSARGNSLRFCRTGSGGADDGDARHPSAIRDPGSTIQMILNSGRVRRILSAREMSRPDQPAAGSHGYGNPGGKP